MFFQLGSYFSNGTLVCYFAFVIFPFLFLKAILGGNLISVGGTLFGHLVAACRLSIMKLSV